MKCIVLYLVIMIWSRFGVLHIQRDINTIDILLKILKTKYFFSFPVAKRECFIFVLYPLCQHKRLTSPPTSKGRL